MSTLTLLTSPSSTSLPWQSFIVSCTGTWSDGGSSLSTVFMKQHVLPGAVAKFQHVRFLQKSCQQNCMTFLKRSNHLEFIISLTLDSGEIDKSRKLIIPDIGFDGKYKRRPCIVQIGSVGRSQINHIRQNSGYKQEIIETHCNSGSV